MIRWAYLRPGNGILLCALLIFLAPVHAQPTVSTKSVVGTTAPARAPERSVFLDRAQDLESRQLWQQAADIYQRALRHYPDDSELRDRWHSAEQLYSFSRRYHDTSFQKDLLELDESSALALYREVLGKVQTHYVRQVPIRDLLHSGYQTLEASLARPVFQSWNFPGATAATMESLRTRLGLAAQRLGEFQTTSEAAAEVRNVVRLCAVHGCKRPAAPVLEFLTGACEELDPYTAHLTPHRLDELYSMIDGNFVGLGVEVRGDDEGLQIVEVLPDSPASRAGLKDGEIILAVDGVNLAGLNAEDAANRLQGPGGSSVDISVRSKTASKRTVQILRQEVIVKSVRDYHILPESPGIGYIRIESFQKNTEEELAPVLDHLEQSGMRSLVIDLRGNPGGLLDISLDVANEFIGEGILVSTKGRAWGQNWQHHARAHRTRNYPLAVLVDGESASASEIFASAIQDHRRGTIIGTRTYGKGSVQSIFPLSSARTGLRLTTALFYSPNGKRLQGVGVEPDIAVTRGEPILGEEPPVPRRPTFENDPQLRAAIEHLSVAVTAQSN